MLHPYARQRIYSHLSPRPKINRQISSDHIPKSYPPPRPCLHQVHLSPPPSSTINFILKNNGNTLTDSLRSRLSLSLAAVINLLFAWICAICHCLICSRSYC